MDEKMHIVTCTAPVNIAIIKYWGKLDEELIIPLNDSISFTLSQDEMCAKTTVMAAPHFKEDKFWLNGNEESLQTPRLSNLLNKIRLLAKKSEHGQKTPPSEWHIHMCSVNNFPTAAGLASSAAGYAALVYTLSQLYNLDCELSSLARLGSGSACRSIYGGLVHWKRGSSTDGSDSFSKEISSPKAWRDIHVIICVAHDQHKKVPSSKGMLRSVQTSNFIKYRVEKTVPTRINALLEAVSEGRWAEICDLVMKDSNEMHSVCLDTFPPFSYLTDTSFAVIDLVHRFNDSLTLKGNTSNKICYTFDAGPNACLFVPEASVHDVICLLNKAFKKELSTNFPDSPYWKGIPSLSPANVKELYDLSASNEVKCHSMKYFIHTSIGDGPRRLEDPHGHLLTETGFPEEKK